MNLEQLSKQVAESCEQMSQLLLSVSQQQDWRLAPEEWSFRYLAGHMAVTDSECWQPRIHQVAAFERPYVASVLGLKLFGRCII